MSKALEPPGAVHLPEAERPPWVLALYQCVGSAMRQFKSSPWAKPTCDLLVKSLVDRRHHLTEAQQAELQAWNAMCKGHKAQRQQEHMAQQVRDQTSFERKESEWRAADIAKEKKGADVGGSGLDGWCAKQSLN